MIVSNERGLEFPVVVVDLGQDRVGILERSTAVGADDAAEWVELLNLSRENAKGLTTAISRMVY